MSLSTEAALAKLLRHNSSLKMVIDHMDSAILIEDEDRRVVAVNQSFCDLFSLELDPKEMFGMDCSRFAEGTKQRFVDPNGYVRGVEQLLLNRLLVADDQLEMVDGRILLRRYMPVEIDNENRGNYWQYDDITENKVIAHELEASRDRAWEASRLKSEFLATMSHEIRTPMNGIIGMSELLMSTQLDEQQREFATIIFEESQALLHIINDILDFSKIEAGKVILDPVPFSPVELMTNIAETIKHSCSRKGLEFNFTIPPHLPVLIADGGRLRQIVVNLLGNAVKFTKHGSVSLNVDGMMINSSFRLYIEVRDTGIGIAPDKLDSLFDPFTQADGSTTRKYGGTGLGLAIVRRLVDLQNGELHVQSEPGVGTDFALAFEMEVAADSAQQVFAAQTEIVVPVLPDPSRAKGQTILIVEDNTMNQQVIVDYLAGLGFTSVVLAGDGDDAVKTITARPDEFALVLMDIQMPRMDGLTATRAIRKLETGLDRHVPIVALTARAMQNDREQCLAAGMDDFLVKPIVKARLIDVLNTYMRES